MTTKKRLVKGSDMLGIASNPVYSDAIELFEQSCDGYRRFHVLKAALDLDIFSWLMEFGPASPHRIAEAMTLNERYIGPLLQTLIEDGFLDQRGSTLALSNAAAKLFAQGSPIRPAQLLAKASGPSSKWSHLATLLHSRVAEPESDTEQESLGTVYPGDYFHADRAVRNWPEFSRANSVLDLGGTGGELAIALCKENLRLRATVLVSPAEVDVLARKVAKAGMVDSITVVQNDVFSLEVDGLYDIVLAVHCLYAFPKRILAAMEKIASLVRQDGLLVTQHWFEEGQEPQWDNCLRELDQRIHHTRRPLRHPDAFADRVTSAGFCWLKGQNLHGHKNGVQLRLAQRCDECEPELDEDESSIKNVKRSQVAAVSIPAL